MMGLSPAARTVASFGGAVSVAAISFLAGRELRGWVPAGVHRVAGIAAIVAVPALFGTVVIVAVNQRSPFGTAACARTRAGEGAFWLLDAIGALMARSPQGHQHTPWPVRGRTP